MINKMQSKSTQIVSVTVQSIAYHNSGTDVKAGSEVKGENIF